MNLCSVFQPNPTFTTVTTTTLTVSGLTPAGFVKTATGAGGLLSTEAFGANTYIPYSSGTGFTYSANLNTNGNQIGVGTTVQTFIAGGFEISSTASSVFGVYGGSIKTNNTGGIAVTGLYFASKYLPTSVMPLFNRSLTYHLGCTVELVATTQPNETKNLTITNSVCFAPQAITYTRGAGSSGLMTIATCSQFKTIDPVLVGSPAITTLIGFHDPGLTVGAANWGCAINTQSYFNANVSIGKNTAPSVALDVVGGHRRTVSATKTTTYQILITDYTIVCEHATVAFTVTLPAASATTIGQIFHIKNIGAAIVSVDQTGTNTLDGYTTTAELSQWDCICIQGQSATGWIII
jgi:hypothetical protein